MQVKEINFETKTFITDNGIEYNIPESWYGLTREDIDYLLNESSETIKNFIKEHNYGEIIES